MSKSVYFGFMFLVFTPLSHAEVHSGSQAAPQSSQETSQSQAGPSSPPAPTQSAPDAGPASAPIPISELNTSSKFVLSLAPSLSGSIGEGTLNDTVGFGLGISLGYHFAPQFSAGAFLRQNLTVGGDAGFFMNFFEASLYGVEAHYYFNPIRTESSWRVGLNAGSLSTSGIGLLLAAIPAKVTSYQSFFIGPQIAYFWGSQSNLRLGVELSTQYVPGGTVSRAGFISPSERGITVPGFLMGDVSFLMQFQL